MCEKTFFIVLSFRRLVFALALRGLKYNICFDPILIPNSLPPDPPWSVARVVSGMETLGPAPRPSCRGDCSHCPGNLRTRGCVMIVSARLNIFFPRSRISRFTFETFTQICIRTQSVEMIPMIQGKLCTLYALCAAAA